MTGSAHVPQAGSPLKRFGQDRTGLPPSLRYAGHPTPSTAGTIAACRGFKRPTAAVVFGALRWVAVWSEVKEEGRRNMGQSKWAVNLPGGASPDTTSPEDCSCLASAWGSVPRHERNTAPRRTALSQNDH